MSGRHLPCSHCQDNYCRGKALTFFLTFVLQRAFSTSAVFEMLLSHSPARVNLEGVGEGFGVFSVQTLVKLNSLTRIFIETVF